MEKSELLRQITVRLQDIKSRPDEDTRFLNPKHVVLLAESIAALGLLEPIVVDQSVRLLAGGHRLAAIQLLVEAPKKRMERLEELCGELKEKEREILAKSLAGFADFSTDEDLLAVPVRMLEFDATKDLDRALAIEVAENSLRRDYTPKEVFKLYERLIEAGYTTRPGKPKKGEKPVKPALAVIIGKSVKTVERLLKKEKLRAAQTESEQRKERMLASLGKLEGAIKQAIADASELEQDEAGFSAAMELITELERKKLHRLIRQARLEVG